MRLVDIYTDLKTAIPVLYQLLQEREPNESISHKTMPSLREHEDFVCGVPYADWRLIMHEGKPAGAVYLTKRNELGIAILKSHRRKGLASGALLKMMREHRGPFLANINPKNQASLRLFFSLGFSGPIQVTLEHQ